MSKVIKFVGRKTDFKGKSLWEILGCLKNNGVGRIVARSMFERYPEPSFMKIVKVETVPDEGKIEENRKVRVWVEKTFRGRKLDRLVELYSTSYKPDYKLIPKNEEAEYCKINSVHERSDEILPNKLEMPPLMKLFVISDCKRKNMKLPSEFTMPLNYSRSPNRTQRIAKGDEKPTIEITMGLGKPISPSLYEGVKL